MKRKKMFPWEPDFNCYDTCKCGHVFVNHDYKKTDRCYAEDSTCTCKRFRFAHTEIMGRYK